MVKIGHYYENGQSFFRIYAPLKKNISIEIDGNNKTIELNKNNDGFWIGSCPALPEGSLYYVNIDNSKTLPDPTSRYQPFGVHGLSMIVKTQPAYREDWKGISIEQAVIYELHLGTFTPQGNLRSATEKIPYLAELGINVIEIMPISTFPGNADWGYDGVYLFALSPSYGTYKDLELFLNKAHEYKIAVILDVVYNHFGPEGNYTNNFAPYTKKSQTPWGAAINFDQNYSDGIREFYKCNVQWWLEDIGFDGMRLDAWAMIEDEKKPNIRREITDLAHDIGKRNHRKIIMIAEHLRNDPSVVSSDGDNCDAQWIDDFGLSIRSFLTKDPLDKLLKSFYLFDDIIKALKQAVVLDGTRMNHALNCYTGKSPINVKPSQNVVYIQNHDMIGNRVRGDRFVTTSNNDNFEKSLLAAFTLFSSNFRPLIFMGEEFASSSPFPFFESFTDNYLIKAVKEGRKSEWKFTGIEPFDSHAQETLELAHLKWNELSVDKNIRNFNIYSRLIRLKIKNIIGYDSYVMKGKLENTVVIKNSTSLTLLNFNQNNAEFEYDDRFEVLLDNSNQNKPFKLGPYGAQILIDKNQNIDLEF